MKIILMPLRSRWFGFNFVQFGKASCAIRDYSM